MDELPTSLASTVNEAMFPSNNRNLRTVYESVLSICIHQIKIIIIDHVEAKSYIFQVDGQT